MVLEEEYCEKCGKQYKLSHKNWCKPCQINYLKENLLNWSRNGKIDNLVQEMQSNVNKSADIIFEWIPYSQFNDIKEIDEGHFTMAIWKDGPLHYDSSKKGYIREQNKKVSLKSLHNSTNITNEFLREV